MSVLHQTKKWKTAQSTPHQAPPIRVAIPVTSKGQLIRKQPTYTACTSGTGYFSARPQPDHTAVLGCVAVGQAEPSALTTLKVGWAAAESHHVPLLKSNLMSKQWKDKVGWT